MDQRIEYCISAELSFARAKFPGSNLNFPALVEEVGELSKALLDHSCGKATADEVFAEAIQVATMAIRVAEEGSSEFPYQFDHSHYQKFDVNKFEKHLKAVLDKAQAAQTAPPTVIPNRISAEFVRRCNGAGCQCGRQKLEGVPLCGVCFTRLSGELKNELRQKKGGELEAVYNQAVEILKNSKGGKA